MKDDGYGNIVKYKVRLVVKVFEQKKRIDFDEIFSQVVKISSIKVILGLVASLHGDLEEEIYIHQPKGFEIKRNEHLVCKLKKSLYGLK